MLINSTLLICALFQFLISGSQSHPHHRASKEGWNTLYYGPECHGFRLGNQCFRLITEESLDWASAREHCKRHAPCGGGDLAQPSDVKAMADYLNNNGYLSGRELLPHDYDNGYWLGGSDRITEGEWRWVNNSIITTATGWAHREPNDDFSCEDCLSMSPGRTSLYGWPVLSLKDEGCGMLQHFICEQNICTTDCPAGFFAIRVTNQVTCFKLLPEVPVTNHIGNGIVALPFPGIKIPMGGSTMEESQSRCKDEGLILAQPSHESAYEVNRKIYRTYGEVDVWVGARRATTDSEVLWLERTDNISNSSIGSDIGNGDASSLGIPKTSSLWYPTRGSDRAEFLGDTEWNCVIMLVRSWTPMGKPYQMQPCNSNIQRPLCQLPSPCVNAKWGNMELILQDHPKLRDYSSFEKYCSNKMSLMQEFSCAWQLGCQDSGFYAVFDPDME